jgi:hypothetical protein
MSTELRRYSFASKRNQIGKILERLFDSRGGYLNNATGNFERSKHFAVLIADEYIGLVCPLPETKSGPYWTNKLYPINIIANQLIMSKHAAHMLRDNGLTIFDAVRAYNERCTRTQICNIITVT